MSNNTILRKYLDILNESEIPKVAPQIDDPEQIVYAETAQGGSVAQIIESVKAFQRTVKLPETGTLDPRTLAAIMSHSAKLAEDMGASASVPMAPTPAVNTNPADTPTPANPATAPTTTPATPPVITREDLENKAELHTGYGLGLRGGSHHDCGHEPGSSKHLHWHHGYSKGSKEFAECMGVMKPISM
jgi:hypothetical protein